jgi:hypothetical protein
MENQNHLILKIFSNFNLFYAEYSPFSSISNDISDFTVNAVIFTKQVLFSVELVLSGMRMKLILLEDVCSAC